MRAKLDPEAALTARADRPLKLRDPRHATQQAEYKVVPTGRLSGCVELSAAAVGSHACSEVGGDGKKSG